MIHSLATRTGRLVLATVATLALGACTDEPLAPGAAPEPAAPRLALADGGTESPVTQHLSSQFHPAVGGTRVVYADSRNGNYDVYMTDVSSGIETRLVSDTDTQQNPGISGDWVVWEDWRGAGVEIRALDLLTGTESQISPAGGGAEAAPRISGHRVVYGTNRNSNHDVYLFDLQDSVEVAIATHPKATSHNADIGGNLVVWQENWGGADDPDIMLRNLATGDSMQITWSTAWQGNPATDGARVVYEDNRHGNTEIYMFDPATGVETRITSNPSKQSNPDISGNVIVWQDERHGTSNLEIYAYDLSTGIEYRITQAAGNQVQPSIDGSRIVWHDGRKGNADVYMFTIAGF